jgi:hypothetical protein
MRYYSSTAVAMALTGSVSEIATTLVVDTALGLPAQTPFTLVVDVGLSTEEIVTVTGVAGTSLTVTRGSDGTTAVAHTVGAVIRHMVTARDLREPQEHLTATANVHGIGATASVVGTDATQTLTNKTVNFADNTILGVPQASVADLVDDLAALVSADANHAASTTAHGATGAVVGTTKVQTLTNKTIVFANNTVTAASEAAAGIVELATSAETVTGTDTARATTPADVKAAIDAAIPGAWTAYTPVLTGQTTNPVLGTGGVIDGEYSEVGKQATYRFNITFGTAGASAGTGTYLLSLPLPAAAPGSSRVYGTAQGVDSSGVVGQMFSVRSAVSDATILAFVAASGANVTDAVPWVWAENDWIRGTITYATA